MLNYLYVCLQETLSFMPAINLIISFWTLETCLLSYFNLWTVHHFTICSGVPMNFVGGWGSTNSVENSEQREWDLWAVALYSGVPLNFQMSETRILIRLLRMYFPRNCEFGSALSKLRNFGRVLNTPTTTHPLPPRYTRDYMYNEQTNAHLIENLLYCSVFIVPTCFNANMS
jgi:hypothetical protein